MIVTSHASKGAVGLPLAQVSHRLEEGFLHGILGILGVAADARRNAVQPRGVALHEERVGTLPPSEAGGNQFLIG